MAIQDTFDVKFTSREVSAWGGLALLKRMLDGLGFKAAMQSWDLPQPGSNRGYAPEQLIEQMIVSIWCGAARFVHADITRLDCTLIRLCGWSKAAGHKAALGVSRLAYNLMSVFRHTVMRQRVHHTLATLHHKVLAVGAFWENPKVKPDIPTLRLAVARQRRHWFEGLWAHAGEPVSLKPT